MDQFTWSILQTPRFSDCDSVAIDSRAHVAPVHGAGSGGPKSGPGSDESVSPQALKPPNLAMWGELGGGGGGGGGGPPGSAAALSSRSPALYAPPDIKSMIIIMRHLRFCFLISPSVTAGIVSGQYPLDESSVGGPLSQMNEAVNNIDKNVKSDSKVSRKTRKTIRRYINRFST